jgi:hypothetical protein
MNYPKWMLVFALLASTAMAAPNQAWQPVESIDGSLPVKRHEAAYVGVGSRFFLAGGRGMNPVSIFDAKALTWVQGSVPPVEIHHFQPVTHKKKIYIAGALTGPYPGETPLEHIYLYDTKKGVWTRGAAIPKERLRGSTGNVIYKGKLYMACGIRDGHRGDYKNWFDAYDLKTGQWEQLPDAPRARDHFQAAVNDDRLYLIGGRRSDASTNVFANTIAEVDVYDFSTKTWTTLDAGLPTERAGMYLTVITDEILVLGGESDRQKEAHNQVEALNTNTHTWRSLPPMLRGRHGTGVVHYNSCLYVASGCGNQGGNPELTTQEMFKLK